MCRKLPYSGRLTLSVHWSHSGKSGATWQIVPDILRLQRQSGEPTRLATRPLRSFFSRGIWGQKTEFDRKKISIKAIYRWAGKRSDNSHVEESGKTENDNATLPRSREETGMTMRNRRSAGFWISLWEKCDFPPKPVAPILFLTPDVVFSWTQHANLWPILFVYSSWY